jgi:hypothetical protein
MGSMDNKKAKKAITWITALVALLIICIWSYWGVNEAFHEGWYHASLMQNLSLTFIQYLSIPIILFTLSLIAIHHKKLGFGLFITLGVFALFFFNSTAGRVMIFIPMLLLASGFYFGNFKRKKAVILVFTIVPLLIILSFGIPQLYRVENRFNDNDFGKKIITGNNVELTWAPQGVGFPLEGTKWITAIDNCARLDEEGTELNDDEINTWRLPSREEIVHSVTKNNNNATGYIDDSGIAQYSVKPDKETPLWNPHSKVIYYWTSESKNEKQAYLVAYNGNILARSKSSGANYQGYRCVK